MQDLGRDTDGMLFGRVLKNVGIAVSRESISF